MVDLIVLGLDGANWTLLEPWLRDGYLPNLENLRRTGTYGDLRSCLPPVTCPNWRCYSTGKNPGKLGVYWWERIDTERQSLTTPDSRSFKSNNYWDYLNDEGVSTGVVNLPMTYPPLDVDGFMVAGGPRSQQQDYATPRSLEAELEDRGYRLHPGRVINSPEDTDAADEIVDLIDERLATFHRLLRDRPVGVGHLTVFYSNVLQHWFWRGEPTKRAWGVIDERLGDLRAEFPEANVVLLSDHGCGEIRTTFHANAWLEREGYLVREGGQSVFETLGVNKHQLSGILGQLGPLGRLASLVPERLTSRIPEDEMGFKREQKLAKVDWERSRAIASGQGLVYVLDDDGTTEELVEDLRELESEVTGDTVCLNVYTREELYDGPYVSEAPDVIFEQYPGTHTTGAIGDNPAFEEPEGWRAENVRTGLYLVAGPDVETEGPDEASITDIAPTILHAMECSVPTDVDGDPLGVFPGEVRYRDPIPFVGRREAATSDEMQSRLEDLGYLS